MVAIIDMNKKPVNESLPSKDIEDIKQKAAEAYGVDEEDVNIDVVYTSTGTIDIDIPSNLTETEKEELLATIEQELVFLFFS